MVTDVKKAIFQAIMMSDDYLHAYEQLMHLNLKKTQEREIVRVLLQCCIAEKTYNPFYYYLSTKLLTDINFKYTYKYALWDYIKSIEKLEIHQVVNLAKIFGALMLKLLPIHFLKVIEFEELDKATTLFVHLLLENILASSESVEQVTLVFK